MRRRDSIFWVAMVGVSVVVLILHLVLVRPFFYVGRDARVGADDIVCEVKPKTHVCTVGDSPAVEVLIRNTSSHTVYLPGRLDNSDKKQRYPYVFFDIDGPDGGVRTIKLQDCSYVNPLIEVDFVELKPGQAFDPFESQYMVRWKPFQLTRLTKPGRYRVTFHYSTDSDFLYEWKGSTEGVSERVAELLRQVPRLSLEANTYITVQEQQATQPPSGPERQE